MFNISVKTNAQVRFFQNNEHRVCSYMLFVQGAIFYDFRALGRPGQDVRAMGRLGLDFRALGHPPATESIILQTLCSIFR